MLADPGAAVSVLVIFGGSAAVPFPGGMAGGDPTLHADAGEHGDIFAFGIYGHRDFDFAGAVDGVDELCGGLGDGEFEIEFQNL